MIRQPPAAVPRLIALAATMMTARGTSGDAMSPAEKRARVMIPIVFWASFEPWLKAMYEADRIWSRRNRRFSRAGWPRWNSQ